MGIVAMIPIIFELLIISVAKATNTADLKAPKVKEDFQEGRIMIQDMKKEFTELKAYMSGMSKIMNELSTKNMELNEVLKKVLAQNEEVKEHLNKLDEKNDNLTANEIEVKSKTDVVFKEDSFLKNPPHYHICVFLLRTTVSSQTMSFEKVLFNECNMCDNADFDLDTGVYKNGWPGIYTVTWDLYAKGIDGKYVSIFLLKNGQRIDESRHFSQYYGSNGFMWEQGGRSLILRLETGDTLSLYCDNCAAVVKDISFCITLSTFDVI